MSVSTIERGDRDFVRGELLGYLRWALDALGLSRELPRLRPEPGMLEAFRNEVMRPIRLYLNFGHGMRNAADLDEVLGQPDEYFKTEDKELRAEDQTLAYIQMLSAMVLSILGEYDGYRWLGSMLVTDHLNRKLTVSRFLALLTNGEVGSSEPQMTSRSQAISWARRIYSRDVHARSWLLDLAEANDV